MAILRRLVALLCLSAAASGAATAQSPAPLPVPDTAQAHHTIATNVPAAQAAFDRGLVMLYAFNIGEARDAFRAAETADPHALLPYVGEAVSETFDINLPSTADGERRAADAIRRGRAAQGVDSPADDVALLATTAPRFERALGQDARFRTYFRAMQTYAGAHPSDAFGWTLAAYAGWNATGRLTSNAANDLTADAQLIADDLATALKLDPGNLGAHHLLIHFWEQAGQPRRALPDADALSALTYALGESHLQHMAGHIYDRLGNYAAMVRVNEAARANDVAYFAAGDGDGQAYMRRYHEHDVSFVLYGLTTVGLNVDARAFAERNADFDREDVALRVRDNAAVLRMLGDAVTPLRVIAQARSGDVDGARYNLAGLSHGGSTSSADTDVDIATAVVARAGHDAPGAVAAYRAALAAAGTDLGDPKGRWWMPMAEGLGAALLEAHQPAQAQTVFADELIRYPADPRLEFGLAEALAAQGKDDRAARAAYRADWHGEQPLKLADLG